MLAHTCTYPTEFGCISSTNYSFCYSKQSKLLGGVLQNSRWTISQSQINRITESSEVKPRKHFRLLWQHLLLSRGNPWAQFWLCRATWLWISCKLHQQEAELCFGKDDTWAANTRPCLQHWDLIASMSYLHLRAPECSFPLMPFGLASTSCNGKLWTHLAATVQTQAVESGTQDERKIKHHIILRCARINLR